MRQSIQRHGLALAGFAAACTLIVSAVNLLTKQTIAEQQQRLMQQTLNQLLPTDSYNNQLLQDCTLITDKQQLGSEQAQQLYRARLDDQPVAAVLTTVAPDGYSGSINIMLALDTQGSIFGVKVLNHKETPGLGDKIERRKSDWITSFNQQQVMGADDQRWAVKKDNGMFDQFTGATITPRAVVNAVKRAALYVQQNQQQLFSQAANCNLAANGGNSATNSKS